MLVLGIESSCDETGVALYHTERGLLAHALHSQVAMHAEYGGVVPELASRDHIRRVLPLTRQILKEADCTLGDIDAIAYTQGPGLAGALLVGASVAASLGFALGVPTLGVHHLEGHLLAPLLEPTPPAFPFVALLVSGGHSQLMKVSAVGTYETLGETLDDAAGEAFDKTAKLLGLGYPGGPQLARLAGAGRPDRFRFPRPLLGRPGLDFSFSGLKTAVMLKVREIEASGGLRGSDAADLAHAFQQAVVETLVSKCLRALEITGLTRLVVAGGVGANQQLRESLRAVLEANGGSVYYPRSEFCTDNAAMVALAGWLRFPGATRGPYEFSPRARWDLEELQPP